MNIVAFRPEHLTMLELQEAQAELADTIALPGYGECVAAAPGQAFTVMDGETVLACGGAIELWPGRALIWSLVSDKAGQHLRFIHRAVAGFLDQAPWTRVEAHVDARFKQGVQWIRMLGFQREGTMRAFTPQGRDLDLYSRVKHG